MSLSNSGTEEKNIGLGGGRFGIKSSLNQVPVLLY